MVEIMTILAVVVGVVGLAVLIGYLKSKGAFNKEIMDRIIDGINDSVRLASLITEVIPFNRNVKDKSILVFDVVDKVADYVYELDTDADKQELALETAIEILNQLGVTPTEAQIQLMKQAIYASFKWLKMNQD